MSVTLVAAAKDRLTFQRSQDYLKLFYDDKPNKAIDGWRREYFVSQYLADSRNESVVNVRNGGESLPQSEKTTLPLAKTIPDQRMKVFYVANEKKTAPVPFIVLDSVSGDKTIGEESMSLGSWLGTQAGKTIDHEVIRTFAMQISWTLAALHSSYGVQHNDVHEGNIVVIELKKPRTIVYNLDGDFFSLDLPVGHLLATLIDFGAADVKPGKTYPTTMDETKPWRFPSKVGLFRNIGPEEWFGSDLGDDSEGLYRSNASDLWMFGIVLMTMYAHGRWNNYTYTKFYSVHMHKFDDDTDRVRIQAKASGNKRLIDSHYLDEELIYGVQMRDAIEKKKFSDLLYENTIVFYARLVFLKKALFGDFNVKTLLFQTIYKDCLGNIKWDSESADDPFRGLVAAMNQQPDLLAFIRRLMAWEPEDRLKFGLGKNEYLYGLTAGLFHPYFARFYRGENFIAPSGATVMSHNMFAPPLAYADADSPKKTPSLEEREAAFMTTSGTTSSNVPPQESAPPVAVAPIPGQQPASSTTQTLPPAAATPKSEPAAAVPVPQSQTNVARDEQWEESKSKMREWALTGKKVTKKNTDAAIIIFQNALNQIAAHSAHILAKVKDIVQPTFVLQNGKACTVLFNATGYADAAPMTVKNSGNAGDNAISKAELTWWASWIYGVMLAIDSEKKNIAGWREIIVDNWIPRVRLDPKDANAITSTNIAKAMDEMEAALQITSSTTAQTLPAASTPQSPAAVPAAPAATTAPKSPAASPAVDGTGGGAAAAQSSTQNVVLDDNTEIRQNMFSVAKQIIETVSPYIDAKKNAYKALQGRAMHELVLSELAKLDQSFQKLNITPTQYNDGLSKPDAFIATLYGKKRIRQTIAVTKGHIIPKGFTLSDEEKKELEFNYVPEAKGGWHENLHEFFLELFAILRQVLIRSFMLSRQESANNIATIIARIPLDDTSNKSAKKLAGAFRLLLKEAEALIK
jgi:hypothetical protein